MRLGRWRGRCEVGRDDWRRWAGGSCAVAVWVGAVWVMGATGGGEIVGGGGEVGGGGDAGGGGVGGGGEVGGGGVGGGGGTFGASPRPATSYFCSHCITLLSLFLFLTPQVLLLRHEAALSSRGSLGAVCPFR